jgi:hypothetical protein
MKKDRCLFFKDCKDNSNSGIKKEIGVNKT